MAENKKSFLFYIDWAEIFSELDETDAGKLVKHLCNYVTDKNPDDPTGIIKMAWIPIKLQLKRDLKKWEKFIDKQSVNGSLGGRPKTQITQALKNKPKKAVTVKVTVTDKVKVTDTVNVKEKKVYSNIVEQKSSTVETDEYKNCVEFWLKEFHPGFSFGGMQGKAMKSIIKKLSAILKGETTTYDGFVHLCSRLPDWYKSKDLQIIDSKFNEIISEIKTKGNGQTNNIAAEAKAILRNSQA